MKIATWNVNSIRVRLEAVLDWMAQSQPDVLCMQEIKVTDELFPVDSFAALGYQVAVSGQKTYNGVAIISKGEMTEVKTEFTDYDAAGQKRFIAATIGGVRVVNVYVPNGSAPDSPKFSYKLEFISQLRKYFKRLHVPKELLVLTGDFNIAPEPRDVYDADEMEGEIGFHPEERKALAELMGWGFDDVFRRHHEERGLYSWWDYRAGAFRRDMGLRIDHIWASPPLAALSTESGMDKEQRSLVKPSDHIPVWAKFDYQPGGQNTKSTKNTKQ
jgi:exodeoxyribonuclease-3